MIDYEQFCRIKHYQDEGLKAGQIAVELGLDSRTVQKWMEKNKFQLRLPGMRPSKLDPYKQDIVRMLERHPYSARQIFQHISEQGFDGGYTIVKEYIRKVRPKRQKAYLKLAFAPGECAQVDWGSYRSIAVGETRRRLSFFVMVLCHCRMMYVEFTVSQTMEHFLGCHQRAFEYFNGVTGKVMVDNLKSAVLKRITGQDPVFNPKYLDLRTITAFVSSHAGYARVMKKEWWKTRSVISKKTSWPVLSLEISRRSIRRQDTGWIRSPMSASMAKHGKSRWICSLMRQPVYPACRSIPMIRGRSPRPGHLNSSGSRWIPIAIPCRPSIPVPG